MIYHIVTMCSIMMHNVIKCVKLMILMRLYSNIILDVIIWLKLFICYEIYDEIYIYIMHHIQTL